MIICLLFSERHSRYSGKPDYEFALKIKEKVNVPVIYSGDVNLRNAGKILEDFDFVFVGREAIGNPGFFQGKTYSEKKYFKDYLKYAKKYNISFRQIKYQAMNFTKGFRDAKKKRAEIVRAKNIEDLEVIMKTNK